MKTYTLVPQDLLFFRDGRPIATSGGHGARWPEPSVIFDALHAALWRAFPERQEWEHWHDFGRSSHRPRNGDTQRFGALATAGLFPVWKDGRWLFPAPADVTPSDDINGWLLQPQPIEDKRNANLPAQFLNYTVASFAQPTKETVPPWWSAAAWQSYLEGKQPDRSEQFNNDELFSGEWTTGIGIDPATQTQDGQHIYNAEYLRLRPEIRCGFVASLRMTQNGNPDDVRESIGGLFTATDTIIVGGQQRACRVAEWTDRQPPLPLDKGDFEQKDGKFRIKWVLLTPAIWPQIKANGDKGIPVHPGGWLPNWICPTTGSVLLRHRTGKVRRVWDEQKQRTVRRAKHEKEISAQLVAACVPKPIAVTGWTERLHLLSDEPDWSSNGDPRGPRPTHLAVSAGAVYYFACDTADDARNLADALNWHGAVTGDPEHDYRAIKNRRSTLLGEKGFGLGVCGTWHFHGEEAGAVSS